LQQVATVLIDELVFFVFDEKSIIVYDTHSAGAVAQWALVCLYTQLTGL
jgi:hypothetical protein